MNIYTKSKVPEVNEEFCIGCGVCVKVCPIKDLIELVEEEVLEGIIIAKADIPIPKRARKVAIDDRIIPLAEYCIICQKCVQECPTGAKTIY